MSIYSNICFYGGGAWGQALAITLSTLNQNSTILVSNKTRETQINNSKSERFPNLKLSPLIQATTNKEKAIKGLFDQFNKEDTEENRDLVSGQLENTKKHTLEITMDSNNDVHSMNCSCIEYQKTHLKKGPCVHIIALLKEIYRQEFKKSEEENGNR